MTDDQTALPEFLAEDSDRELVFDEPAAAPPPRRASRRKSGRAGEAAPRPAPIDAPVPAEESSTAAPQAAAEEPAGAPAPFPPQVSAPAGSKPHPLLLAVVALALVTSLLSLGALIMVGRTLAHAEADRRQAHEERAMLRRVPELVARLDGASSRLDAAARHFASAAPSGKPATVADIRHELDLMKIALAGREPSGVSALDGATRNGFSEISTRLDRIEARLDRAPPRP
ncbi:MAG TPA: hypothetical protein VFL92_01790 [Sphingomonas sp.]|nr:hypothetical protein [Sphingomonas sp.]